MCEKSLKFLLTEVFFVVNVLDFVVINKYSAVELPGSSQQRVWRRGRRQELPTPLRQRFQRNNQALQTQLHIAAIESNDIRPHAIRSLYEVEL
jgi:hypothetical protein